ncbi:hypothetical protein B0T26DRAFT_739744 [Lasiosphaeria miniovina]|uniref:Uncharacterized protein n=1 Tax=Lasiosphaeria miniovina TaxID=1954250 RepID=A0AA40AV56_9PEZI|nr:uncharacterized protein B0T26DRAFT_739744 [Lasiosphaeria miniovina]KAK0722531.1 hypothetical protein B0T26DRAFT_739744 [Lasiosphaeria miniovina]
MASATSAMSLSNFQLITSSTVPISCILAYNTPIRGCSESDFDTERTCSVACVNGLIKVQQTLQAVCDDTSIPDASVLGQVLQGNLVQLLCPGKLSTTAAALTTTLRSVLTSSTVRPTTSSTQSSSSMTQTEQETSTSSLNSSPTALSPTFVQSGQPAPTSFVQQPGTTANSASAASDPTPPSNLGGGSPFDPVPSDGSGRRFVDRWLGASCITVALGLLLLQ